LLLKIGSGRNKSVQAKRRNVMDNEAGFLEKVKFHFGQKTADECKGILDATGGQNLPPLVIVQMAVEKVFAREIRAANEVSRLPTNSVSD
jgi:hypothetical protein